MIRVTLEFDVAHADVPAFRESVPKLVQRVREREAGRTLLYELYTRESNGFSGIAYEAFVDAAALEAHLAGLNGDPEVTRLMSILKPRRMTVAGGVPDHLLETLGDIGAPLTHYLTPRGSLQAQ